MTLESLNDIVKYLERFRQSDYVLSFDSYPDETDPPDYFNRHVHKFWELKFNSLQHRIILIPPGMVHCSTRRDLSMDISRYAINIIGLEKSPPWKVYVDEETDHGCNLIPEILNTAWRYPAGAGFDPLRRGLIRVAIENILLLLRQNLSDPGIAKRRGTIVETALDYMENFYYLVDLSISDIAGFVGVSPQHLNSAFRKATGKTTRQNLISIRLNHARELLADSQYFVKEVASLTGWRSPFYLSNSFRREFGVSPGACRSRNGGRPELSSASK